MKALFLVALISVGFSAIAQPLESFNTSIAPRFSPADKTLFAQELRDLSQLNEDRANMLVEAMGMSLELSRTPDLFKSRAVTAYFLSVLRAMSAELKKNRTVTVFGATAITTHFLDSYVMESATIQIGRESEIVLTRAKMFDEYSKLIETEGSVGIEALQMAVIKVYKTIVPQETEEHARHFAVSETRPFSNRAGNTPKKQVIR